MPADSRLFFWLSWAILLAGLGSGLATLYIIITTYSPLPQWDEWVLFDHLARGGWSLPWLWAQHNEHRILTTRILFLLDVELFQGKQVFLLICVFLVQLLQVALLSWSLRFLEGWRGAQYRIGIGLIAYSILCPTQYENLVWGFELHFVITACMATLATVSLLLLRREGREKFLVMSITAATLATWSLANGMLLWPLLVAAALWLRMRARFWRALLIAGALNIGLYFLQYHRPAGSVGRATISQSLRYVIVYFGSTFVRHSDGAIAMLAGIIGILAAAYFIIDTLRDRDTSSPLLTLLSLLMLFTLATAAITSTGRQHLGIVQATASRYQTFVLLFWCCLGLALLSRIAAQRRPLHAFAAVLLIAMLGFATQVRLPLVDAQWRLMRLKKISLALLAGVEDPAVLADAYPDPQVVLRSAAYMKEHRLSIFAGKQFQQLGRTVDSQYQVTSGSACTGTISSSQLLPAGGGTGLRLTGFAWDRETQKPAADIVVTENDRIVGFGTSEIIPLFRRRAKPQEDPSRSGWIAFAPNTGSRIQLYAVAGSDQSRACPFAATEP